MNANDTFICRMIMIALYPLLKIACVCLNDRTSNTVVKCYVVGQAGIRTSVEGMLNYYHWCWLEHVLHPRPEWVSHRALLSINELDWTLRRGAQSIIWLRGMMNLMRCQDRVWMMFQRCVDKFSLAWLLTVTIGLYFPAFDTFFYI